MVPNDDDEVQMENIIMDLFYHRTTYQSYDTFLFMTKCHHGE